MGGNGKSDAITSFLSTVHDRITGALPPGKPPGRYLATVKEYLIRNPDLFQCERHSLADAIIDAALLGLELGAPFDLASILPFKDRASGGHVASLIVEYRGHMAAIYRTGRVVSIEARAVYKHDDFSFELGQRSTLRHQPTVLGDRGPLVYAYAIARMLDGETVIEVITQHDAHRAMADSPGSDKPSSLWHRRAAEMWTKTAIKKLAARLPREPIPSHSGPGPPVEDYEKLVNAVCAYPELYRQSILSLEMDFPTDSGSIAAVLAHMRTLYRQDANGNDSQAPPEDNQQPTAKN